MALGWAFVKGDEYRAQNGAERARVIYLSTYHEWRISHPEVEVLGIIYMVPKNFADRVDKWRQFLPPCGPVRPRDRYRYL